MKKYLLLLLPAFSFAQQNTTTLTVNISEIYSLVVDANAVINLDTKESFIDGARSNDTNLNVFATNGYKVTAVNNTESLNDVQMVLEDSGEIFRGFLEQNSFEIYQSNIGTLSKDLKVVYELNVTENYLNRDSDQIQTTITFTITAL